MAWDIFYFLLFWGFFPWLLDPQHHWAALLIRIVLSTAGFGFPGLLLAFMPFNTFKESCLNFISLQVWRIIVVSQMWIKCFYLWD